MRNTHTYVYVSVCVKKSWEVQYGAVNITANNFATHRISVVQSVIE
jgi:hypothetical protein